MKIKTGCCQCGAEFRICEKCFNATKFICPWCEDVIEVPWYATYNDEQKLIICEHVYKYDVLGITQKL